MVQIALIISEELSNNSLRAQKKKKIEHTIFFSTIYIKLFE